MFIKRKIVDLVVLWWKLIQQPFFLLCTFFALFFLVFQFYLVMFRLPLLIGTENFIPLHYNIFFGIDDYGHWKKLYILPISGFVLLMVNQYICAKSSVSSVWLSKIGAVISVIVELFLLVSVFFILLMNISYVA